jgi:hypothetical protein
VKWARTSVIAQMSSSVMVRQDPKVGSSFFIVCPLEVPLVLKQDRSCSQPISSSVSSMAHIWVFSKINYNDLEKN